MSTRSLFQRTFFLAAFLALLLSFGHLCYAMVGYDEKANNSSNARLVPQQKENSSRLNTALDQSTKYAPGRIIIKFKEDAEATVNRQLSSFEQESTLNETPLDTILPNLNVKIKKAEKVFKNKSLGKRMIQSKLERIEKAQQIRLKHGLNRVYILELDDNNQDIFPIIENLKKNPNIEYAEPDFIVKAQIVPDDPYYHSSGSWGQGYDDLWGIKKIQCEAAWDISQGEGVVVAVIDTGVDYNHPDLKNNIWTNEDEIADNGVDDDGNGYIDDVRGFDFAYDDSDPLDVFGHGTHAAGTIAAEGNNSLGVIGVAPKAKIMAVKGLDDYGSGSEYSLANAVIYAADNGAKVLSNSWGGEGTSQLFTDAFHYAYDLGCVSVVAAGNSNMDVANFSPASIDTVIAVAASTQNDEKCSFSNWGDKIDVTAPGGGYENELGTGHDDMYNILSTMPNESNLALMRPNLKVSDGYWRLAGTSMACPHVAGIAALILSNNPTFSNDDIRQVIRVSADDINSPGFDTDSGYGRINAQKALQIKSICNAKIENPIDKQPYSSSQTIEFYGTANGEDFLDYKLEYKNKDGLWVSAGIGSNQPIENSFMGTLSISSIYNDFNLKNSLYFKLTVRDQNLLEFTDIVSVYIVDAYISYPAAKPPMYTHISGAVDIIGEAGGIGFDYFLLQVSGAEYNSWIDISPKIYTPVHDGLLFRWDSTSINNSLKVGLHRLRLVVYKKDGQMLSNLIYIQIDNLEIRPPFFDELLINNDAVIKGSAHGGESSNTFDHYVVEYGFVEKSDVYAEPAYWMDNFLILPNEGRQEVSDGTLAEIDVQGLMNFWKSREDLIDKSMTMRVLLYTTGGLIREERWVANWLYTHGQKMGWPFQKEKEIDYCNPILADINKDGKKELLISGTAHDAENDEIVLHLLNSKGEDLSSWPLIIHKETEDSSDLHLASSAIGDVNGDNRQEIVLLCSNEKIAWPPPRGGSVSEPGGAIGLIYVINYDGLIINEFIIGLRPRGTLTLADIDNDKKMDMIFLAEDVTGEIELVVVGNNGLIKNGWPQSTRINEGWNNNIYNYELAVGDLDGDGKKEIAVATLEQFFSFEAWELDNRSYISIYKNNGSRLSAWEFFYPAKSGNTSNISAPVLADMDEDGLLEVCFSTAFETYVKNIDGTNVAGWPVVCSDFSSLASRWPWRLETIVGDMDQDGKPELFVSCQKQLWGWHSDGQEIPGYEYLFPFDYSTGGDKYRDLMIGDIDGDKRQEILYSYSYSTGMMIGGYGIFQNGLASCDDYDTDSEWKQYLRSTVTYFYSLPIIGDFDDDGNVDIISSLGEVNMLYGARANPRVTFWNLDAPYDPKAMSWPMYRHDPQHTGCYTPSNRPPVFTAIDNKEVQIGHYLLFPVSATDSDGDKLRYGADNLPKGAIFISISEPLYKLLKKQYPTLTYPCNLFYWQPKGNQVGIYKVTFWVEDLDQRTGKPKSRIQEEVTITVKRPPNKPPWIQFVQNHKNETLRWRGYDLEDKFNLEYSYKVDNSTWSKWTRTDNVPINKISKGLKKGNHTFCVKARDGQGCESEPKSASFSVK